jgi:translation elongation factor EF-Ts
MMECKSALTVGEHGDFEEAMTVLRKRGLAVGRQEGRPARPARG